MRRLLAVLAATALIGIGSATAADASASREAAPTADEALAATVTWLVGQQQPNGGFGAATPDAVLALAESAQTESSWGTRPALEGVESEATESGADPLDAVRAMAFGLQDPQLAAQLITDVALPLGLEVSGEGPFGDLTGIASDGLDDPDTPLGARIEIGLALMLAGGEAPADVVEAVVAAQQANGGWNAAGDPDGEVVDLETTGAAVDFLVRAGQDTESGAIPAAMAFVAAERDRAGAWPDTEGDRSAAATAAAIRAIRAVGHDATQTCWQTRHGQSADLATPEAALIALQHEDGAFGGDDSVRQASEAVHALSDRWLPLGRAPDACAPKSGGLPFAPSLVVLALLAIVGVGGGLRIMRGGPSHY